MDSGFSGGGPEYYAGGFSGRSSMIPNNGGRYLPQMFLDQTAATPSQNQIPFIRSRFTASSSSTPSYIGKRTLAEFQASQNQPQFHNNFNNISLTNLLYQRPVKSRGVMDQFQRPSPMSSFTGSNLSPAPRYPQGYLQQKMMQSRNNSSFLTTQPSSNGLPLPRMVPIREGDADRQETEKKLMVDKRLQELEKQLLEDEDGNDVVSVLTDMENSMNTGNEWSETLNLVSSVSGVNMVAPSNPISPSPTTSSSSSTSSVSNPVPNFSKQGLLEAASAISDGKNDVAMEILSRSCIHPSSPNISPEQKLVGIMANALKSRITSSENSAAFCDIFSKEHVESVHALHDLSPCFNLCYKAANLAIIKAARDFDVFHILDFDVGQGVQYANLLNVISSSGKSPSTMKLTGVIDTANADEEERLSKVGEMLRRIGERVEIEVRFHTIRLNRLSNLTREAVGVEDDEPLAVNFPFKLYRIPDESVSVENPRDELLRRVRDMQPVVVTLLEQEMNVNTAPFLTRVNELCSHYGSLLESMEGTEKTKAECCLGRRITNSVACEGRERVERCEMFGKWRVRFGMAGFKPQPIDLGSPDSILTRPANPGLTLEDDNGGICFRWMGKTLTVASAWH